MDKQNDFKILIIDDNPAIHLDFQKILKMRESTSGLNKLNQLVFGDKLEEDLEKSESDEIDFPGFQIDCVSQGEEGVQYIQQALEEGAPYALAFVDIRMPPGLDGVETIKRIWALDQEIQIVICTAYSDYTWEETVEELGLSDNLLILKKPFDSISVRQLACSLTKKWRLMQESKNREEILEKTVEERTDSLQKTLTVLEYQSTHDSLTNLPNRSLLVDRIKQEISRAKRHNSMFAVIFIDLDRFKLINDSFNHESGDMLLKQIAKRLSEVTREEDIIARLSGDEFICISVSAEVHEIEHVAHIAKKILDTINKNLHIGQRDIIISASLGISIYPQDGTTVEELLHNADLAMYRAKALGGNQFQLYTPELQEKCIVRLENESDLRRGLIENEFFLEYQPQYDNKSQKLIGVEALIRWRHPKKGIVLPMDFIPVAEETGLIVPIGEWVIKTACSQNKAWQDKGIKPFPISVNIATKQFIQPNFVTMIKDILKTSKLDPKYLKVEVTENVIINAANVIESIHELKKLGVSIVLDDFGVGNSGFNYLNKLPIDQLKIDQSFIKNINFNRSDEVILQAIIDMADKLHLDVVVEGVETSSQVKYLESHNCHKFQGFYFNKPMSAEQLEHYLKT
ncbi:MULTISPECIES: two-component system response regulator [Legionella]|uniref:EAL domain-containing protein n=1 Tax=Legionella resiliens TaxID=2905958 RepID=A0ABS8WYA0_9GAMM|nr:MULTISPECIES: EAL domain-containing protein [unclassified Legionella]MCE0722269.1 EAL domain-containing protein [Legionella sp. 9fVS26]MCE3531423.1 EAL domain-containing protein [Legionella sp. 8cVS16]QLZ67443.1 GGDEF domain-containing response regulator [Legionella sp. PC1000]